MEKSIEVYNVAKCPLCGNAHKYSLAVLRSSFLYGVSDTSTEKRVHRLLTCPTTGKDFEGIVILKDDPKNKIASVTVEGLIKEKE